MKYSFTLNNEGWLPISCLMVEMYPDFSYVEDIPQNREFELLPGESYPFETTMVCKYRGVYRVGVKKIILRDFLKLFTLHYPIQGALEAIVYPRIPEADEYDMGEDILKVLQRENPLRKDGFDQVVREYMPGDALRRIQWQATAKTGKLQSRREIGEERNNIFLFLDTKRTGREQKEYLPIENKKLELLLFMARECLSKGQPVTLVYPQKDYGTGKLFLQNVSAEQYKDFDRIYDAVKEMEFYEMTGQMEQDEIWNQQFHLLMADACWFFILENPDENMKDRLREWQLSGMDLAIYLLGDDDGQDADLPISYVSMEEKG